MELPAEVADVGDPRREHTQGPNLNRATSAEREALVRDVVSGRTGEDVPRPRPPEPERAPGRREIDDLRRAVCRQVIGEPLLLGHARGSARHHAEPLLA